jgi:hypothetical protein
MLDVYACVTHTKTSNKGSIYETEYNLVVFGLIYSHCSTWSLSYIGVYIQV